MDRGQGLPLWEIPGSNALALIHGMGHSEDGIQGQVSQDEAVVRKGIAWTEGLDLEPSPSRDDRESYEHKEEEAIMESP